MQSTRRQLLVTFTGLAGLTGLCVPGWRAGIRDSTVPATAAALLRLIDDRRHALKLGRSYLRANPLEDRPEVLSALLERAIFKTADPLQGGPDRLWSVFDARVRAEFGAGELVRLDGWILARSEARLCALYAS